MNRYINRAMKHLFKILFFLGSILWVINIHADTHFKKSVPFRCAGTNPQWSLTLKPDNYIFQLSKERPITYVPVTPRHAENLRPGYLRVYQTQNTQNESLTLLIEDNFNGCTDGTSRTVHRYSVFVITKNHIVVGCCDKLSISRAISTLRHFALP